MNTPTPHINAKKGDFAPTVLMSGDPFRAQYIATHFLTNAVEVTNVRGMLGFTGTYAGTPISVMGHGMGIPSAAIYITELFRGFGVEQIIRAGSCGAIHPDVYLNDLVIAMGASTDSLFNRNQFNGHDLAAIADYTLLSKLVTTAQQSVPERVRIGNIFSTDLFYTPDEALFAKFAQFGILGIDMEAAALYGLAAQHKKKAATICTVSDHLTKGIHLSSDERQTGFNTMIEISLNSLI